MSRHWLGCLACRARILTDSNNCARENKISRDGRNRQIVSHIILLLACHTVVSIGRMVEKSVESLNRQARLEMLLYVDHGWKDEEMEVR